MGIPYSREINAAFEQVTPLVQSGYEVLNTTKNIAVALFVLEIFSAILLIFILFALIGLLITMNPDLENERKVLVTPALKWIASWWMTKHGAPKSIAGLVVGLFVLAGFCFLFYVYYKRMVEDATVENEAGGTQDENEALKKGKDVENVKKGNTEQ
jgi:hypothetical protein